MQSSDQFAVVQNAALEGVASLSNAEITIEAFVAAIREPQSVTAAVFWPLYMQISAEADAVGLELGRRCEAQPNFDVAAFERQFVNPAWARRSAFASLLISAPVVTERDLIAKAYVIAEDLADGIIDKHHGAQLMADCLASLKKEQH